MVFADLILINRNDLRHQRSVHFIFLHVPQNCGGTRKTVSGYVISVSSF